MCAPRKHAAKFLREKSFAVCPALKNLLTTQMCKQPKTRTKFYLCSVTKSNILLSTNNHSESARWLDYLHRNFSLSPSTKAWDTARRAQEKLTSAQGESLSFYNSRLYIWVISKSFSRSKQKLPTTFHSFNRNIKNECNTDIAFWTQ